MLTRCPTCSTTFRVTPEQLKARQGRVRCGACQSVFNALDTLVETAIVPPTPIPTPAQAAAPMAAPTTEMPAEPAIEPAMEPTIEAPAEPTDIVEAPTEAEPPAVEEAPVAELDRVEPILAPAEEGPVEAPKPAEPEFLPDLEPPAPAAARRWPWALGLGAAVAVLAAQATLHFRTEIAVLYPDLKPLLVSACASLGCEVALPRRPDLVGIEASDLSPTDGKLLLAATVKNRAPFAQEYPHLELTLTDTADRALVRRVISPADYLPPQTAAAAGLGSNAELVVNLLVDAPGVGAAGYRLYLFYP